ncbi:MAG: TlpA family protein disulfide reductase [Burkholderiales bacterium]
MKRNFLLFFAVALLFTGIGAYFGDRHLSADRLPAPAVRALFASSMPGLNDQSHPQPQALAQWKGKILLVNFWATWCTPCVQEIPALSALQTGTRNENLQIIGIGIDSAANMLEFSVKYKISYPLYVAGIAGAGLLQAFGDQAGGLPFSVLVAPDGQIKRTYQGRLNMNEVLRDIASI